MSTTTTIATTTNKKEQLLTVYRGWFDPGKYVWSPFVIKLEARLRFAGVNYKTECGSTKSAPKGKIPYIEIPHSEIVDFDDESVPSTTSTTTLGDSTLIIKYLVERGILPGLNVGIEAAAVHDLAIRALMEEKLCFYHSWERWICNYYTMRDHILSALPYPVRVVVGLLIYRTMTQTLHGQGTTRHTPDEIRAFRREIWENINALLVSSRAKVSGKEQPFWILGREEPTEADATVFGFIVSVLVSTACPESQQLVKEFPVILDYAGRIHDRYFPDYVKWT